MVTTNFSTNKTGAVVSTNLSAVITATNGASLGMRDFTNQTVWVSVSGNTGAVTITIQASHNGTTWFTLSTKTYTAVNGNDNWDYSGSFPFMRTTTSTQSASTVTTTITGSR